MSTHAYLLSQSQRSPPGASQAPSNANGFGAPTQSREGTVQRQWNQSRLSLSVGSNEKDTAGGLSHGGENGRIPHPLRATWVFYFRQKRQGKVANYEEGIKKISAFSSIESFWSLWTHLSPPSLLQPTTDYLVFHIDVKRPVWEDPFNIDGGKWIVRLRKGVADRLWEDLVLAMIGDQFEPEDEVCGCVLSARSQEDILSLWHKDEKNEEAKVRIKETIRRCLNLPQGTTMEYKTNNDSLHDKSSFRTVPTERISAS